MAIFSRILTAIIGGYWLANVMAITFSSLLTGTQANNLLSGMLMSFSIYAAAVIWVFAAKTAKQACTGILIPCVAGSLVVFFMVEGSL